MKNSIKLIVFTLLTVIILVCSMVTWAIGEDTQAARLSTTEVKPVEEQPVETQSAVTQPVTEQPHEEQPATEPPAEAQSGDEQAQAEQTSIKQAVNEQPVKEPIEDMLVTVGSLSTSSISLNLYAQKNVSSIILYVFTTTDRVVVLDQSDEWVHVDFNNLQGYIATFEPITAKEPIPNMDPVADEEPIVEDIAQVQANQEKPAPEIADEADAKEDTAEVQRITATGEQPSPDLAVEPISGEDTAEVEQTLENEEHSSLDITVEPDAIPADCSVGIYANVHSALYYGDLITLTGVLSGEEGLIYTLQWQQRDQGGSWYDLVGENTLQYSFTLTEQNEHSEWKLDVRPI